jgi:hypothetical protein
MILLPSKDYLLGNFHTPLLGTLFFRFLPQFAPFLDSLEQFKTSQGGHLPDGFRPKHL